MNETRISLKSLIAPHFWNTFDNSAVHIIDKGGRGSTKTSKNALYIATKLMQEKNCSAIILRRYQKSLRDSVFKEMKRAFNRLGAIEGLDYTSTVSPTFIKISNGNNIYFAGGDDYEKIKGLIDEKTPIKIVWFEEFTEFSDTIDDIDNIIATFTRGNNDWFKVLYSFNPPKNKFNNINKWCEDMGKRDDVLVTYTDYRTVPEQWLGKMFIEEADRLKQQDEKRYRWIYLGEVVGIEGMIYNLDLIKYISVKDFEEKKLRIIYVDFSIDGGHQTSATTCLAFGYATDGNWYLLDTYYYSPNEKSIKKAPSELSLDIFNFQIEIIKKYQTRIDRETIDSAEGALRNQVFKDYGKRINPVNKGKNKEELIDYSQNFLARGKFYVIDNDNNKIFKKESQNYKWQDGTIQKGKPEPDKTERPLNSNDTYYNTYNKDYSYYYCDHTMDSFQYWVKDNLQKLGLKE